MVQGGRHAEAEARWREDQVGRAEAEARLKAEVERLRRSLAEAERVPSAASTTSAAAVQTYWGPASDLQEASLSEAEAGLVAEVERPRSGTSGLAGGGAAAAGNGSPGG